MYYLSDTILPTFDSCANKIFVKGEHHITRTFYYNVLLLVYEGTVCFYEDGKEVRVSAGEYYIQRSGLYQEGREESLVPKYYYVHFLGQFNEKSGIPIRGHFDVDDIRKSFEMLDYLYMSRTGSVYAKNALFYDILSKLNPQKVNVGQSGKALDEIEKYILVHFADSDFSVSSLNKLFYFSEDYLIRLFKERYKKTPYKYVTELRIEYAKQLMLSTSKTVGEIANECGYNEYSVFYKSFVQATGKSPKVWREEKAAI